MGKSTYALFGVLTACGGIVADQRASDQDAGASTPLADGGLGAEASFDGGASRDDAADAPAPPPAGPSDGVCTPGDVTLGLYDPDCVYILGSTQPGSAYARALFHPSDPTRLAVGWGTGPTGLTVRSDGKLLFDSFDRNAAFVFAPGLPTETIPQQFARHTLVSTPACSTNPWSIHLHPRSGSGGPPGYYQCIQGGSRYYEIGTSTQLDLGGRHIVSIDENGAMLVRAAGNERAIIDGASEHSLVGIEPNNVVQTRSKRGGGFLVAAAVGDDVYFPHLFELDAKTGIASDRGAYHMGSIRLTSETVLEPSGALVAYVTLTPPFGDGVVRLRLDAPPEIVFDDSKHAVKLHGTQLVTGP